MTDFERFNLAKKVIDKLANGQNPYNSDLLPNDSILNDVVVARALFVASEALDIAAQIEKKKIKKPDFSITSEELTGFRYSEEPIFMSEIIRRIEELKSDVYMKKLPQKVIVDWLIDKELLNEVYYNGKCFKEATETGIELGITSEWRHSNKFGKFLATLYDLNAQTFIIDNLPAILEENELI